MGIFIRIYILYMIVQFTIISHQVIGEDGDDLTSTELRRVYRYYKNHVEPKLGFVVFNCGMKRMKVDLESIWPECPLFADFTRNVMTPPLTCKLRLDIQPFVAVEMQYSVLPRDRATKNMPNFFKFIYACITRHRTSAYGKFLTQRGLMQAQLLRKIALDCNGLTENDSQDAKDAAFEEFTLFYSRFRQACNGYHHTYLTEIIEKSFNQSLPEIMYSMGLLSMWNFSAKDMIYMNKIRSVLNKPAILTAAYDFEVEDRLTAEKTNVSGFLPYIDIEYCPSFPFSLKISD